MNEVPSLVAELWHAETPDLNAPALLDALRQLSGAAEQQDGSLVVPHPGSGDQPLLTVVMAGSPLGTDGKQRPDTSQTWDWAETEAAVATGQASVLITELFPGDAPVATRVAALVQVVRAVAAVTGPDVLAYLAAVLALTSEEISSSMRRGWGISARELGDDALAEALAGLTGQPARPAHGWLVLGGPAADDGG